ncbi:MAG TPA: DUF3472 domain-containing protein [Longimicrobium sp.]|nr:DUF3472 domain-containing protein [Longimicrobium sp.]
MDAPPRRPSPCLAAAALFALVLSACEPAPTTPPPPPQPAPLQPVATNLSAIMGAQYPQPLAVKLTGSGGVALAGVTVNWETGSGNGWVFPAASVTDASGIARTTWIAGENIDQTVLAFTAKDTARIRAQAARTANRANSVHLRYRVPGGARAEGFRVDIHPYPMPPATYYAASNFDGGYTGLQVGGDLGGNQVIFSVWDVNGVGAVLVDAAGSTCDSFGGEGTGIKCRFLYPWNGDRTYRFEVRAEPSATTTDITTWFTDVAAGITRKVATLRLAKVSAMNESIAFVEDFGPVSPSCTETAWRAMVIRDPEYLLNGTWTRSTSALFTQYHPRTVCGNVSARLGSPASLGTMLSTGSTLASDPAITTLPVP